MLAISRWGKCHFKEKLHIDNVGKEKVGCIYSPKTNHCSLGARMPVTPVLICIRNTTNLREQFSGRVIVSICITIPIFIFGLDEKIIFLMNNHSDLLLYPNLDSPLALADANDKTIFFACGSHMNFRSIIVFS